MLLSLLELVDAGCDRTMMNARNLALALTPAILVPLSREPLPTKEQLSCVAVLIKHRSEIFSSLPAIFEEQECGRARLRPLNPPNSVSSPIFAAPTKTLRGAAATQRSAAMPAPRPKVRCGSPCCFH
jgi:hypothetical protein